MTAHADPSNVLGYTSQKAGTTGYAFAHSTAVQAPGSPAPHDARPGYLNPGEPLGIHPVIQSVAAANVESQVVVATGVMSAESAGRTQGWNAQTK